MRAEVLLDAMSQVTGVPTEFKGFAAGWRAEQLPDSNVDSYFFKSFGRPMRQLTCECERTATPSMVQVLHISNGDTLNHKLAAKGNRIEQLLAAKTRRRSKSSKRRISALSRVCRRRTKGGSLSACWTKSPETEHRAGGRGFVLELADQPRILVRPLKLRQRS